MILFLIFIKDKFRNIFIIFNLYNKYASHHNINLIMNWIIILVRNGLPI